MRSNQHPLMQTVALFVLVCGAFTALLGFMAEHHTDIDTTVDAGTMSNTPLTVVIDAGHGGEDGGTQSATGLYEKTVNLEIAQMLETMLQAAGISTVMTRTEDILLYDRNADYKGHKKMLDLATRRKIAEQTQGAVFVSIHMNSFPEEKYHGLQVFYSPNHTSSEQLARKIQQMTREQLQPDNDRKIKRATSSIYLLDRLHCPAVLCECGFLSNSQEAAQLQTEEYRRQIAFVLFSSILSYISEQGA